MTQLTSAILVAPLLVMFVAADSNTAAQPLVRQIDTGYLLNCCFLSPRPYCWPSKATVKLSGWEVDKAGGDFDFKPGGVLRKDFFFHSEWFKLVDTSTNAAVTLKHQIVRQTDGQITLEFRFKLPQPLNGASWQLRDLEKPAVSLDVENGNLCWGKNRVLTPIELNHDYGVKVVADLTAKKADVYIDGELKGQGCVFIHPVTSIDYFLVKTGDATTGEMFLNPVNMYKGYQLNETFVTSQPGKLPDGWKGRNATVEQFECGTKPDIFSLKVDGEASRTIGVWPVKTVFECRFLLPSGSDGATIDLAGVRLETLATYRSNLWYMAKVIAEPQTRTAEVYLNGKLLAQKLCFEKAEEALRFAGKLWVDDLLIYPWRDYPSDYVPEPKPVKSSVILGVQSCNLWREGTAYAGWDYVYPYRDKRKPLLGWYDEGNPEETDWEIKWQVEHGIGFEMHCWYRPNNAINHPIKDGVLDQGIIKGLFNAKYSHLKKFAIMCTDEGACESNPTDWKENIIPYWIEYFFKDPRYMKIDGKPLLSIYQVGSFIRMMGGENGARQAIQTLREEVAKAGLPGIIVLMELRSANRGTMRTMKSIGVDYCYAYTWGTPNATTQRKQNSDQRDAGVAEGFGVLPSISMGWGRQPWGVKDGGWLSANDYKTLSKWAKDDLIPTLPADSLGRRIVMLPNWNEFGEGHFLMPSTLAGFGYLDALRAVFADGGPHEDTAPTDQQKRRFTVLFPKE
ncbi:MAG: glycoside hydrolase family 99-like domain-containing protein [bacterium]